MAHDLEIRKQKEEATRNLGEAYMAQKKYTAALREYIKAEKFYSKDHYLQNDLGLAYMAKGKMDLAIVHFKKALETKPDYAPAKNNLGTAYMANEDWDLAIQTFQEVSSDLLYATPHYPLYNIGFCQLQLKRYDEAEKNFLAALEMQPDFPYALRGLGRLYLATGKPGQAILYLTKAIKVSPRFAQTHFHLGEAHAMKGENDAARAAFSSAVSLDPDGPLAAEAKKRMAALSPAPSPVDP